MSKIVDYLPRKRRVSVKKATFFKFKVVRNNTGKDRSKCQGATDGKSEGIHCFGNRTKLSSCIQNKVRHRNVEMKQSTQLCRLQYCSNASLMLEFYEKFIFINKTTVEKVKQS